MQLRLLQALCGDTFVLVLLEDLLVFALEEDPKYSQQLLCFLRLLGALGVKEDRFDLLFDPF